MLLLRAFNIWQEVGKDCWILLHTFSHCIKEFDTLIVLYCSFFSLCATVHEFVELRLTTSLPEHLAVVVNWTSFRVVGLGNKFGKKGQPLSARLESTLRSLLGATIKVVNAFPSLRGFIVQVANLNQASAVVRSRPNLKGSSIVVLDVFSPEDHWPSFWRSLVDATSMQSTC